MTSLTDPRVPGRQRRSKKLSYYLAHRQASPLEVMLGAARWYHRRAVRATERVEAALEREDESKRDQLATIKKLLALAVHPGTPPEEAASADHKAEELLATYAEGLSDSDAAAIAAANSNWDKAAEHAARCAPYLHHKLAPVDRPVMRKISEMTDEELAAAAQEAREEIAKLTENQGALVKEAIPKAVH
jgi:Protein of unknown function (DUF2786)